MKKMFSSILLVTVASGLVWHYLPQTDRAKVTAFVGNIYNAYNNEKGSGINKIISSVREAMTGTSSKNTRVAVIQNLQTDIQSLQKEEKTQRATQTTMTPSETTYYQNTEALLQDTEALLKKLDELPEEKSSPLNTVIRAIQCPAN